MMGLIVVQARELQDWEDNPESFHHQADPGAWQDHLKSCAETLLASLLEVSQSCHAFHVLH